MIISERYSIRIVDLYFGEPRPESRGVDIFRYNQCPAPIDGAVCALFPTVVLDLSKSPDQMLANMKRDSREKIRQAEREERRGILRYEYSVKNGAESVERFANHFDRCATAKAMPNSSRSRLTLLARNEVLDVSHVSDLKGELLAASCSILTPKRIRGLYAAATFRLTSESSKRSLISRANRYLYWRDFLRFKEMGAELFDFGGYYVGNSDAEKLRINRFKASFGGEVRTEFNCEECITLKGRLAHWIIGRRNAYAWRKHKHKAAAARRELSYGSNIPT
jgi:hypothetical protein